MNTRGIYDRHGEQFGYLIGTAVYDLDDNQTGTLRDGIIYSMTNQKQWIVRGDGLYTLKGESVGYLGSELVERKLD